MVSIKKRTRKFFHSIAFAKLRSGVLTPWKAREVDQMSTDKAVPVMRRQMDLAINKAIDEKVTPRFTALDQALGQQNAKLEEQSRKLDQLLNSSHPKPGPHNP